MFALAPRERQKSAQLSARPRVPSRGDASACRLYSRSSSSAYADDPVNTECAILARSCLNLPSLRAIRARMNGMTRSADQRKRNPPRARPAGYAAKSARPTWLATPPHHATNAQLRRPLHLAAGLLDRTRSSRPRHQVLHCKHVVRIAFGRMRLAHEHRAHELMIPGAKLGRAGLQRDLRRQLESGKRARELHRLERALLVCDQCQRPYRSVAEPITCSRGTARTRLHPGIELGDMRRVRLIPPPFHGPPAQPRLIRYCAQAFQLEQRAPDGHLLVQPELSKLFQAGNLIASAHHVDQHLRPIGFCADQIRRVVGRAERYQRSRKRPPLRLKLLHEPRLHRVAIGIIGSEEIPLLAKGL